MLPSTTDPDFRPAKKRFASRLPGHRPEDAHTQTGPIQPQGGNASTWYTNSAFSPDIQGASTIHPLSGTVATGQLPCPPGTLYLNRSAGPESFDHVTRWPGAAGHGGWVPNNPRHYVEPQTWLNADAAGSPGHALWGSVPSSPVGQVAAVSVPYHWSPWPGIITPGIHSQEQHGHAPASAAYYPGTSLSSPATFLGTEPQSDVGFPLNYGNETLCLAPEQRGYGHEASAAQANYPPTAQELHEGSLLGSKMISELTPFEEFPAANTGSDEYRTPVSHAQVMSNTTTTASSRISSLEPSGPHLLTPKQSDNKVWIKKERRDHAERHGQGSVRAVVRKMGSVADEDDETPKSGNSPNGKEPKDRKKRTRFKDEGQRKETSNTRSIGACLRCHNQRVRVSRDSALIGPF